jgi:hypothetical protein
MRKLSNQVALLPDFKVMRILLGDNLGPVSMNGPVMHIVVAIGDV